MFTSSRRARLVAAALRPLVAAKYPIALPDEYRYAHLSLALIDTIYSIGARYEGTHATVLRYARHQQLSPYHDAFDTRPPLENQEPLSHLVQLYHALGIETMMTDVYQNRQRTSTQSGIPKAEAVLQVAQLLQHYHINYFQDLFRVAHNKQFESQFKTVPGQRSGISLTYFWMLTGADDMIKPDRHILNCLCRAIKITSLSTTEAVSLLRDATALLHVDYPLLTARALDYVIWESERQRVKSS